MSASVAASRAAVLLLGAAAVGLAGAQPPAPSARTPLLGAVEDWKALPADGVEMRISQGVGPASEPALRIDYDFHGRGGWAAARRTVAIELPPRFEIRYQLRGEGPANNLELKLTDASAENVWWHVDRAQTWPGEWTPVRVKQRQIAFAWGPTQDKVLRRAGALEITVSAAEGGRGTLWVAGLELVAMPTLAETAAPLRADADATAPGYPAAAAVDGDEGTAWRPGAGGGRLTVDLGGLRELGGVTLAWERPRGTDDGSAPPARGPRQLTVQLSIDGRDWSAGGAVVSRGGALRSEIPLPEAEARYLRVDLPASACGDAGCGLAELIVRPLAYGASKNDFITALAAEAPRGTYPRGFSEAVYWTVVGAAGAPDESLFSEDGALEAGARRFSIEPFVRWGGGLFTWADVETSRSLAEGDLPIPTVIWKMPGARLEVMALASGDAEPSRRLVRYRLVNDTDQKQRAELILAARPFQVDPPYQFLNSGGGVAPTTSLECAGTALNVDGHPDAVFAPPPAACGTLAFDEGPLRDRLVADDAPAAPSIRDATALATAALRWTADLAPGRAVQVVLCVACSPDELANPHPVVGASAFVAAQAQAYESWRAALGRVELDLPPDAPDAAPLLASLRSNLAWILIHRDGPAIQPGSRSYARSWIRDGALTGEALLRLGHASEAAEFARWFAEHQYPDGKVPCCVDRRGADPVPENDSHGELIHLIAEVYRYTRDRDFATQLFPHVSAAVDAIEALRQQRRAGEYAQGPKQIFFGLLPESISHEGYSAKPVHSYWDDTFAYRGLDDAVVLAKTLGKSELAATWTARRDHFRADFLASIARVRAAHHLAWLPASADLADFDSTSTTTMLDPGGLLQYLPRVAVDATFERFWQELIARRDGQREWEAYTPYELRHVGSFVRLSLAEPKWKARAHELLAYYLRDQRPPEWNAWPEAVHRDYRAPKFLGDLPHGWVGSDFIRSFLDLFAFERREDQALVLGAGVPASWLARPEGIAVRQLATPWGALSYSLARRAEGYRFHIEGGLHVPAGGVVLVPPTREPKQRAVVDGVATPLAADGTVTVRRLPAVVDFFPPRASHHGS
ncbi:MAG TPA: discoidin domain-containing protein [Thermoanaerobaculia bacterium]|nr:discoidin domain-containing protein [Thermoanaerobaculia bacterium]